jgi:hypothetical protein
MAWPKTHPNYRPAGGGPARGVGKGDGWGGPAIGAGTGGPARAFTAASATRHAGHGDPKKMAARALRSAEKKARIEHLIDQLGDLALNAQREETQVSACIAVLNRLEGRPVKKSANIKASASLEELILATQAPKG